MARVLHERKNILIALFIKLCLPAVNFYFYDTITVFENLSRLSHVFIIVNVITGNKTKLVF